MNKNINDKERVGRVITGVVFSSLAFWGPKNPWFLLFAIPGVEGLFGKCLLYKALGVDTRKNVEDESNKYFPIQSSSERASGHPIVGVS